ncbi:MAG TPA: DNA adenine methylase [Methylococcaceae bacterium]|nr:DNA adenine methylase [Methylococcaceae bacterium]
MKYMGSKNRIAKNLLPIMLKNRTEGQWWVEPFVGGANMIDKVNGNRIGSDTNKYLISVLNQCEEGMSSKLPDKITEQEYNDIKKNKDLYPEFIVGHCGFNSTFGAKWFGGYARARKSNGWDRDVICGKNALIKQEALLKGVLFICSSYCELEIPDKSIIYCDPPYQGTTKYKDSLNYDDFWQWCRDKVKEGHDVFISEYNAPDDFVCVWQQDLKVSIAKSGKQKTAVEKLFIHKTQLEKEQGK